MMARDLSLFCTAPESSIRQAMQQIDHNSMGIVLVCRDERLLGTLTDGDIRRAILLGMNLEAPVEHILSHKSQTAGAPPVTATVGTEIAEILELMRAHSVRQVPLLDAEGRIRDLITLDELVPARVLPLQAVVMAGGYGKRLGPLTEKLPKPMLLVGDRPLLQRIVEQLRDAGIHRVNLTTHYRGDVIQNHFGDGREFGVEISYVEEDQPLGTAGALCKLERTGEPLLIMNGDILTNVDFRAMYEFHQENDAYMTIAVRQIEFSVPYGVIETNEGGVTGITEKPVLRHFINAGIFLVNPDACRLVPTDREYDMPDLINRLVAEGKRVVPFPVREYWLDIGHLEHYLKAQDDVVKGEL